MYLHMYMCKVLRILILKNVETNYTDMVTIRTCIFFHSIMYNIMLNKNSLAVKKVRGQSEATMAISDQNL